MSLVFQTVLFEYQFMRPHRWCLHVVFRFSQCSNNDIGSICQTLWDADSNSLVEGKDFQLNLQNQLGYNNQYDMASRKLFLRVNEQKLRTPTFVAFKGKVIQMYINKLYNRTLLIWERLVNLLPTKQQGIQ
jgi:hypothetical protein